jgi:uncharacterized protein YkwD
VRWTTLTLVLIASALPTCAAEAGVLPASDRAPAAASAQQITQARDLQTEALAAINELRRTKGLRELRLSSALSRAGLGLYAWMARHGFFGHSGWDGSSFWERIEQGYRPLPQAFWEVGENLVWASPTLTADQALKLWLKSPRHRKNLLTPAWREIGLGGVHALAAPGVYQGLDVTILTADFGVR